MSQWELPHGSVGGASGQQSRESGLSTKPRPNQISLEGKALFFLLFTRTESPGTTGNRVNQVTERKVNIGKVKEDLNPFSSFLRLDKDPANTENHRKP